MRLCMLAFYFGPLPPYFQLTLRSMGANEDVDWIIFTDQDVDRTPRNVRTERRSFDSFTDYVKSKFDFPLQVPRPYKLADTRPAFGYIFEDILEDYDLWGFSDLDIIFGQITKFLTPELVARYEKFFLRGHFSIYRNTVDARAWFRNENFGTTFREAMARPSIQYWDEWQGINKILTGLDIPTWDPVDLRLDIDTHHYLPRIMYQHLKAPILFWEAGSLQVMERGGASVKASTSISKSDP